MPLFSVAAKNLMLNSLPVNQVSLHSDYSTIGGNEITGGVPAYARRAAILTAASAGVRALIGVPYIFDVPASTVAWVGLWSTFLGFIGMVPNGADAMRPFAVDDTSLGTINSADHGFIIGDTVVVWSNSAGFLPVGLVEGTIYYVVSADISTLQLSESSGGGAVSLTLEGNGYVQRITPVTYIGQDQFTLNSLALDATVAA